MMGDQVFNPGGNHGLFCVQQMENIVGPPGLTAVLLLVALIFLTYLSAETIEVIRKALNPVKYLTSKVKFTVTNNQPKSDDAVDDTPIQYPAETANGVLDTTDHLSMSNQLSWTCPLMAARLRRGLQRQAPPILPTRPMKC